MDLIAILTITQVVSSWTSIIIAIGCVLASAYVADRLRRVLVNFGLDVIQLYTGYQMARLDVQNRQQALAATSEETRLKLRQQRLMLLSELNDG